MSTGPSNGIGGNASDGGGASPHSNTSPSLSASLIQCASFNQNHGCFAIGLEKGFRVYNSDPVKEKVRHSFEPPGITFIEMLFRCNYLALVGKGSTPMPGGDSLCAPNKVVIWDDLQKKEAITLEFPSDVKCVRLRRDRIIVALNKVIKVFTFTQSPVELLTLETSVNERGICVLCPSTSNSILAYPGPENGKVHLIDLGELGNNLKAIHAHETPVSCIALNQEGTQLATASEKGTLIRIFDTNTTVILHELRRGTSSANIYCINFSKDSTLLCVSSDHGTIHVFTMNKEISQSRGGIFKLLNTPRSQVHIPVPEHTDKICAFTDDQNGIVVIGHDGTYRKYVFDDSKASFHEETSCNLLELGKK